MKYKLLGHTGLRVSELSLGTMTFGPEWGWGADRQVSQEIFDAFAEAGGNFVDTANRYTEGTSEKLVGEFIQSDRDHFVVATKYTLYDREGDPNFAGNHRKNMMRSIEASLKRLNTDHIDLFYLHAWDFMTPVEEILRGIDDLVRSGKILYAGISDTPAWVVSQMNTIADLRGWTRFNAYQLEYSLIERTPERDMLPAARSLDMAVTAWAALAGGALTGKYLNADGEGRVAEDSKRRNDRSTKIAEEVVAVADEIGCTPAQVALNWVRQKSQPVIPIIGARKLSQIEDSLKCLDHPLESEHISRLEKVSEIEAGFPHEFLATERIRNIIYASTQDNIENHRA